MPEQADREISKRLNGPLDETAPTEPPITVCELLSCRMGFGIVIAPPGTGGLPDVSRLHAERSSVTINPLGDVRTGNPG